MSRPEDSRSQRVASRIDRALVQCFELSSDQAGAWLESLARELSDGSLNAWESVEVSRRLAEARLSLFFDRKDGEPYFDEAWLDMENLGYSSSEREASMLFLRAKNLLERADRDDLEEALIRFRVVVETKVSGESAAIAAHFHKVLAQLESEANSGRRADPGG